jgi:hypothetical protein
MDSDGPQQEQSNERDESRQHSDSDGDLSQTNNAASRQHSDSDGDLSQTNNTASAARPTQ